VDKYGTKDTLCIINNIMARSHAFFHCSILLMCFLHCLSAYLESNIFFGVILFERTRRRKIAKQFSDGAGVSL
jgi:hypothetical protein